MTNLEKILQRYSKPLLVIIFIIAVTTRWWYLPQGALTFGYDQARDAFLSEQIISGHLKIQGPPASTTGLFHGVFYYYLLAPAYLIGHDNPIAAAYWISFLNSLTVFIIFYLCYQLTRKPGVALLSAFIFAISFQPTQYANWLSNPTIGIWTVPLIYVGLWAWTKEKKSWGSALTALGLGMSIQGELFLAYQAVPVIIWLCAAGKKISKRSLLIFTFVLLLSLSTMIISYMKFGTSGAIEGIKSLFLSKDALVGTKGFGDFVLLYLNQFGTIFTNSVMPFNQGYAGAFGWFGVFWIVLDWLSGKRKEFFSWQPFLMMFLFAHLTVVSVGGVATTFLTVGLAGAAIIITSIVLSYLWDKNKFIAFIIFSVILISNMVKISSQNGRGQTLFSVQNEITLKNEKEAIDYTYLAASEKPFSISTLTSPLKINVVWSYLYNWYGFRKYGYLPYWIGPDQIGQLGNNLKPSPANVRKHFFIMEPTNGIPDLWITYAKGDQDAMSVLVTQKNFGDIVVQERTSKTF